MLSRGGPAYRDAVLDTWSAKSPSQTGQFNYLVHYATLAANSHNSQPWRFSQAGANLVIRPDMARATPAADPDHHHLYASLGCAAENLSLAATAAGSGMSATYNPEGDGAVEFRPGPASMHSDGLFEAILERQCTRSEYDGRAVNAEHIEQLQVAAKVDGCSLIVIPDQDRIERMLELAITANTTQIEDAKFTEELKQWIRFNGGQAAATRDGLYTACTGNPSLPPFLGRIMLDLFFTAGSENDKLARQVRSSSGLAVFVTDKDDKAHWVQSGRSYQRFALRATTLGIRHAFVNQLVDVPAVRAEVSQLLGLTDGRADLAVRYGYAPAMPRSLRRPVGEVIA
ncbi:MAG: Tat pathway signal protein [Pseudomonadota bacterium]